MHRIFNNFSILGLSQLSKSVIRLVSFSVITKNLEVADYGTLLLVIAYCELFQIMTLPGMSKPLVRSACEAPEKINNLLSSKSGFRNIAALAAVLTANLVVGAVGYSDEVITLVRYYSAILVLDSLRSYVRIVFQAYEKFGYIAVTEIFQSVAYLILVVLSVATDLGLPGILAASIISTVLSLSIDYSNSKRLASFSLFGRFHYDRDFVASSIIFTAVNVVWMILTKVDILMLGMISTAENVGIYGVANRFVFFCLMAISVVSNVIYPPIVKRIQSEGHIFIPQIPMLIALASLVIAITSIGVHYLSPTLIILLTSSAYAESASIFIALWYYIIIQAISTPLKLLLYALKKEFSLLFFALPLPFLKIGLNFYLFEIFGIIGIAYSTVIVYSLYLVCISIRYRKLICEKVTWIR